MKEILLETLDGYEFQKFVADLFEKLGFVNLQLGPPTADGGIDISMEEKSVIGHIRFIVECKHHPEGTIGRPVVQKLHSAVMATPTLDKGLIVTSGKFSNQAIQYAEEVGIELIDGEKLKELAQKVGLSIKKKLSLTIENCFPVSDKPKITKKLFDFLRNDLRGFDEDSTKINDIGLRLMSAYLVDYSINATFLTSVGTIHSINESSSIFLTGDTGDPLHSIISNFLLPLRQNISELDQRSLTDIKIIERGEFTRSHKEIKGIAQDTLIRAYTTRVSYYGANNRLYQKLCIPRKKDITILDIKRVYVPFWDIILSIIKTKYAVVGIENTYKLNVLPSTLIKFEAESDIKVYPDKCMICLKDMKHEKYVCNECGIIVCDKDSSKCKICERVICKEHTMSKRKFLVLSDKYCPQCAKSEGIIS